MDKSALLIAFHFPPVRHSSGIQRTLKFMTYLKKHGWSPMVLSAHPRAYEAVGDDLLKEIPSDVVVERAFALDTSRHLAFKGRYLDVLARPDRYGTWWIGGVISGLRMIRKYRPKVIWSTSPVPTSQKIGYTLHRLTGIPWVVDLRDPITEPEYPPNPEQRRRLRKLEDKIFKYASKVVVTTPGTLDMYKARYPGISDDLITVIGNGFDEQNFLNAESVVNNQRNGARINGKPLTLTHAGILYPEERDPTDFFTALSQLKKEQKIGAESLQIVLRGTCYDQLYAPLLKKLEVEDLVKLEPAVAYESALQEMIEADGLLLFQGSVCNHQVPAKMYEYFRAQTPIFALTDQQGDTARILSQEGIESIVSLNGVEEIKKGLMAFVSSLKNGEATVVSLDQAKNYSREAGTQKLIEIFKHI